MTVWTKEEVYQVLLPLVREAHVEAAPPLMTGVSIDSRTLHQGDLFFALKGERTEGHHYVGEAFNRGAALAILEAASASGLQEALRGKPHMVVVDSLKAMELLGDRARERNQGTIIGITGSVGKTSVRHVLGFLLARQGKTTTSQKSYNNHWGVPLSLCHLDQDSRFGVFEMGMNAPGEIRRLTLQVRPHVALITLIGQAHIGRLGSMEAIARAKGEIFSGLDPLRGVAVLNGDSPCYELLLESAKQAKASEICTFSLHREGEVRLLSHEESGGTQHIVLKAYGKNYTVTLPLRGAHWIPNLLGVFGVLQGAGADLEQAAHDMADLTPAEGRGEIHEISLAGGGHLTLIDDSYNANPTSMTAGIALLATFPGRRIAVLGDMLELGDQGPGLHEALASHLIEAEVDTLYTCGSLMEHLHRAVPASMQGAWRRDAADLIPLIASHGRGGDVVLIKGSNSMKMQRVVEALCAQATTGVKPC